MLQRYTVIVQTSSRTYLQMTDIGIPFQETIMSLKMHSPGQTYMGCHTSHSERAEYLTLLDN